MRDWPLSEFVTSKLERFMALNRQLKETEQLRAEYSSQDEVLRIIFETLDPKNADFYVKNIANVQATIEFQSGRNQS